ncbi:MAG: hypothetical protein H6822_20505 [Planctomycetaceae bacterium]|nr:hypothetical protein [Planctomycetales bacterium]MCB9924572.1 hypothetical protein [Planctomycetaceae bacterium]
MATLTDTHGFIKQLVQAGVPEKQAEAIVEGVQELNLTVLVSKDELELALARLETRFTTRLAAFLSIAVAVQSAIIALIKIFP